jgi:hypothetical protein
MHKVPILTILDIGMKSRYPLFSGTNNFFFSNKEFDETDIHGWLKLVEEYLPKNEPSVKGPNF